MALLPAADLRPYTCTAFADGHEIRDRNGNVSARIHGPNSRLAGRVLDNLNRGDVSTAQGFLLESMARG